MTSELRPLSPDEQVANAYKRARWAGASQTLAYHRALAEYRQINPKAEGEDASAAVVQIITATVHV
jgi:hypothetical protein